MPADPLRRAMDDPDWDRRLKRHAPDWERLLDDPHVIDHIINRLAHCPRHAIPAKSE